MANSGKTPGNTRKPYNLRSSRPASKRLRSSGTADEPIYILRLEERKDATSVNSDTSLPYLLNIYDDCLIEICKYLSYSDLCNLADVCKKLKSIAQLVVSHSFKQPRINKSFMLLASLRRGPQCLTTLIQAQRFLSNFGEFISHLFVKHDTVVWSGIERNKFKLMHLISKYSNNIQVLTVARFSIKSDELQLWRSLWQNLTSLTIMNCGMDISMSFVLSLCCKLKYLKMDRIKDEIHLGNIPNLEKIKLHHCLLRAEDLSTFIRLNPNLNKLSIMQCRLLNRINFKEISNLKHLKEFELNQRLHPSRQHLELQIQELSGLKSLEKLSLNCYNCPVSKLIEELVIKNVPIQYLHLVNGVVDEEMITNIAQLTGIKILKLDNMDNLQDEHLIKLTKQLMLLIELNAKDTNVSSLTLNSILVNAKQLTSLEIGTPNFQINDEIYDHILDIVKNRSEKSKLKLTIYGCSSLAVSRRKMSENDDILCISELIRNIMSRFRGHDIDLDFETDDEFECDWNILDDAY